MALRTQVSPGGELLLSFEECIEPSDAPALRQALGASSGSKLVLDFGRLRHIEDFSLALVAREIAAASRKGLRVRGLGHHQLRLLEYFGVRRRSERGDASEAQA